MAVTGLHHVSVTVADMDRALAFWSTALGLELAGRGTVRYEHLDRITGLTGTEIEWAEVLVPGGGIIELFRYREPADGRPDAASEPHDRGATHVCLQVTGLDSMLDRLIAAGHRPRSPGAVRIPSGAWAGWRDVYVHSPDGVIVELSEPPSREPNPRPT